MDSGCSRHMTGSKKWFSSVDPVIGTEYITFEDKSRGKKISHGSVRMNKSFVLKDVAFVSNLHFNLLSISQLFEDDYEVCFKKGLSQVLDAQGIVFVRFPLLVEFLVLIFHFLMSLLDAC
jgi:hypothetical protein